MEKKTTVSDEWKTNPWDGNRYLEVMELIRMYGEPVITSTNDCIRPTIEIIKTSFDAWYDIAMGYEKKK